MQTRPRRVRLFALVALVAIVVPIVGALWVVTRARHAVAGQILTSEAALAASTGRFLEHSLAEAHTFAAEVAARPSLTAGELRQDLASTDLVRGFEVRSGGRTVLHVGSSDRKATMPIVTGNLVTYVSLIEAIGGPGALDHGRSGSGAIVERNLHVLYSSDPRSKNSRLHSPAVVRLVKEWRSGTASYRSVTLKLRRLTAFAPLPNSNLGITIGIDESEALAPADRLASVLFLAILAFVIVASFITYFVSRTLWRSEERLREQAEHLVVSEERYRATVESLPDAVSVFAAVRDPSGEIVDFRWTFANAAASGITGFSPEELVDHTLLEVLPDHRDSGMFDAYRELVATGVPYENDTLWYEDVWGDGTRRNRAFDVRATKVADGFVVVTREVTDLREAAQRLSDLADEQKRLNDIKSEFVGVVAHDLRAPLTAIGGFADLIAVSDTDDSRMFAGRITAAVQRMNDLVHDVLDVSAIEAGEYHLVAEPFDVAALVREAAHEMSSAAPQARLDVEVPTEEIWMTGDANAYRRVLANLIGNAIKYAGDGCAVEVRRDGDVTISVVDRGPGIPAESLETVFDRFTRLPGTDKKGTGLGLYICRQLVEQQGGRIWATSVVGEGSVFAFTIPAKPANVSAA